MTATHPHTGKKNKEPGAVYVTYRNQDGALTPDASALADLWEQLGQMDDLTSDVLLVCLAACAKTGDAAWIDVDAVLDARRVKRIQKQGEPGNWQHGHRTEDRRAVGVAFGQLVNLWIELQNVEIIPAIARRKGKRLTLSSRAILLSSKIEQDNFEGEVVLRGARVRLGDWASAYQDAGIKQLGVIAQKALAYNPRTHQPEKRLAKYLAFHYKYNPHRHSFNRPVGDLLNVAGLEPDPTRPQRTVDRIDKALNQLQKDGVIGTWRPLMEAATRPARGWFGHWLKSMIEIEPPPFVQAQYASIRS